MGRLSGPFKKNYLELEVYLLLSRSNMLIYLQNIWGGKINERNVHRVLRFNLPSVYLMIRVSQRWDEKGAVM